MATQDFNHLTFDEKINVIVTYKYRLKSTRKHITGSRYFQKRKVSRRSTNSAVMFLRAPKHFKTGKQHLFHFSGTFTRIHTISVYPSSASYFLSSNGAVYNSIASLREFNFTDCVISRVSVIASVEFSLSFYGRCFVFSVGC